MSFNQTLLVLYGIHVVVYLAFLIQQALAFEAKFGYLCEASGLGEHKNARYRFYNIGYFLFGLLGCSFAYNLSLILNGSVLANIGIVALYIANIALCFIALFPRDTFYRAHMAFSAVLFVGTIVTLLALIKPIYDSVLIPNFVIVLNIFIPISLSFYSYLKIKNIIKFGLKNNDEKNVSIWEWIPFVSTFIWNFIMTSVLLLQGF